jgi:hypothetical protein
MKGLFRPKCVSCGTTCATIEIIPPHELPLEWADWSPERQKSFREYRKSDKFYLLYSGPGGGNGSVGDAVSSEQARLVVEAFCQPTTIESIRATGFYDKAGFCLSCSEFYCPKHWSISDTGYGMCPKGHGQGLDPHY